LNNHIIHFKEFKSHGLIQTHLSPPITITYIAPPIYEHIVNIQHI